MACRAACLNSMAFLGRISAAEACECETRLPYNDLACWRGLDLRHASAWPHRVIDLPAGCCVMASIASAVLFSCSNRTNEWVYCVRKQLGAYVMLLRDLHLLSFSAGSTAFTVAKSQGHASCQDESRIYGSACSADHAS
jgi:hypothetical protein